MYTTILVQHEVEDKIGCTWQSDRYPFASHP
jgi:hypothetical protein